jgi:hypothetical protein
MQPPGQPMPSAPFGGPETARDAVNLPAILLMVIAGLSLAYSLFGVLGGSQWLAVLLSKSANLPPEMKEALANAKNGNRAMELVFGGIAVLANAVVLYGGLQMRNLKMYGLGIAASIIVMIPCFTSCCCFPGLGVGIWALVVLNKPEVKSAFS